MMTMQNIELTPRPLVTIDQDAYKVVIDYYPSGKDNPFNRYSVCKFLNFTNHQKIEPAGIMFGGFGSWIATEVAIAHAGYIAVMANLALQLDRLFVGQEDFGRVITIKQVGVQLMAEFEPAKEGEQ